MRVLKKNYTLKICDEEREVNANLEKFDEIDRSQIRSNLKILVNKIDESKLKKKTKILFFIVTNKKLKRDGKLRFRTQLWSNYKDGDINGIQIDAYAISFFEVDQYLSDSRLWNELISNYIIINVFKTAIRQDIGSQIDNLEFKGKIYFNREKETPFYHDPDKETCIYNFKNDMRKIYYELLNPMLCDSCRTAFSTVQDHITEHKQEKIEFIRKKKVLLEKIIMRLKYKTYWSILRYNLFKNPLCSFIFSGFLGIILVGFFEIDYLVTPLPNFINEILMQLMKLSEFIGLAMIINLFIYYGNREKFRKPFLK